ncbi:MAG TPA: transglutaminase family protein [Casimicrobiaceae bacterium]|jgi:transglutaminase-like putative cysteine protease|nr:transglutaminase family protein [Casimicrobiaceae bacterium]
MKSFNIDCELEYDVAEQTLFLLNIAVPITSGQRVRCEVIAPQPEVPVEEFRDAAGGNRFLRINVAPGHFSMRYLAAVDVDAPVVDRAAPLIPLATVPPEVIPYVLSSRYCQVEQLFPLACREFGHIAPAYAQVEAVCAWIRANIAYRVGTSSPATTAGDVLANRAGVCRDFAHLAVALCRALNIPARFVTGYTRYEEPPPDFHAVFEAYLGGRWQLFDPTELAPIDSIVRIGAGRDAVDVAFATFFGKARLRRLSPLVEPSDNVTPLARLQTPTSGVLLAA